MIALALALTLLAPQDGWKFFGGTADGDVGIAIDPASIEANGAIRQARGRMTQVGDQTHYILINLSADCTARIWHITHTVAYEGDQPMANSPAPPPGGYPMTREPLTPQLLDYLCKS